ncbi:hypothetical protein AAFF_G00308330 [Aldrovandia affinis]|uniref:MADF domain-containing protein n=1 Tax=Aldrovandia affinis TaxID=143900 RepID=A0AAD7WR36_9TELE|nr:hypothetical protein AAFF_G00308330 [Aldrovandia affinis]
MEIEMEKTAIEQFEELLSDEVRKYKHLYDPSSQYYKNHQVGMTSWREIGKTLDEDPGVCMKKWKAMRDKFVRLKKKNKTKSGDLWPEGQRVPAFYMMLSWLHGFVKHRSKETNFVSHEFESDDGAPIPSPAEGHSLDTPMATLPLEERDDIKPIILTEQFSCLTPVQPHTFQQPAPRCPAARHPAPSPEPCSLSYSTVCKMLDDDEGVSNAESTVSVSSCQPAKKRKRVSGGEDLLERIAVLRQEQMASYTALVSQLNANPDATCNKDEFFTFALAVADSLRKLPAERVEATKCKLFAVLGEAHVQ